jgi:hypothetical protein
MVHSKSMLVYFNDVLKWHSAHRTTVASLGAFNACEVMTTWNESSITIGFIANLANFT